MTGNSGSFPGRITNLSIRRRFHASSGDPSAFYSTGTGVKGPGPEGDYSASSSVQVNTA